MLIAHIEDSDLKAHNLCRRAII